MTEWTRAYFQRRRYVIEGAGLDAAKSITVIVEVDGKQIARVCAREPGLISVVSKPQDQGIEMDVVELKAFRYPDQVSEAEVCAVEEWQYQVLGL